MFTEDEAHPRLAELMTEVSKFIRTLSLNEERHDMAERSAQDLSSEAPVSPRKGRDVVENAAAATTTNTATTGVTNGKPLVLKVFKNQEISFTDRKGKIHTYVASRNRFDVCQKCYPFSGNATEKCARPCFAAQCSKCKYFGHHASNCMQMYNVENGEPVTHA
jgi:hypothetical protein